MKDWLSKADCHPALPPGRIQNRLNSQNVDSQKRLQSWSEEELHIRPSKIGSTLHSGTNEEEKKNWTGSEEKEDKLSKGKNEGLAKKVDLEHPVFSQKMLEELRERREETPPMETSRDLLNGMQK